MSEWVAFKDGTCVCWCGEHHAKGVDKPSVCDGCGQSFADDTAVYREARTPATSVLQVSVLEARPGLWCRDCGLPAGSQVSVSFAGGGVATFIRCTACGSDDVEQAG